MEQAGAQLSGMPDNVFALLTDSNPLLVESVKRQAHTTDFDSFQIDKLLANVDGCEALQNVGGARRRRTDRTFEVGFALHDSAQFRERRKSVSGLLRSNVADYSRYNQPTGSFLLTRRAAARRRRE